MSGFACGLTKKEIADLAAGSRAPAHYKVTRELANCGRDIHVISMLRSGAASPRLQIAFTIRP
jgi:hypothetical protein